MNAVQGELITSGSTNTTQLVLTDVDKNERKAFFMKVVSGTVKFGVNDAIAAANGWTSSDTIPPISCFNGELYFDATGASDTFVVTATPG
ncbi:MAG TPA: hypothetical protein VM101_13500 [Flavitalea sp.]|nr:hypothetical protein [Flavitalea sp.]